MGAAARCGSAQSGSAALDLPLSLIRAHSEIAELSADHSPGFAGERPQKHCLRTLTRHEQETYLAARHFRGLNRAPLEVFLAILLDVEDLEFCNKQSAPGSHPKVRSPLSKPATSSIRTADQPAPKHANTATKKPTAERDAPGQLGAAEIAVYKYLQDLRDRASAPSSACLASCGGKNPVASKIQAARPPRHRTVPPSSKEQAVAGLGLETHS